MYQKIGIMSLSSIFTGIVLHGCVATTTPNKEPNRETALYEALEREVSSGDVDFALAVERAEDNAQNKRCHRRAYYPDDCNRYLRAFIWVSENPRGTLEPPSGYFDAPPHDHPPAPEGLK